MGVSPQSCPTWEMARQLRRSGQPAGMRSLFPTFQRAPWESDRGREGTPFAKGLPGTLSIPQSTSAHLISAAALNSPPARLCHPLSQTRKRRRRNISEDTQLGGRKSRIPAPPIALQHPGAGTGWRCADVLGGRTHMGELPGTGRRTGCPGGSGERTISFTSEA